MSPLPRAMMRTLWSLKRPQKSMVWSGRFFSKMWEHEDMKRLFTDDYKAFDLVASTVVTVYNQAFKTGGALPQNDPMQAPGHASTYSS